MNETPLYIGMLGCGTVGSGVVQLLRDEADLYAHRGGRPLKLKRVAVRDLSKTRPALEPAQLTHDPWAVVNDPEIGVLVEVMGGREPARELILAAIRQGKAIVTANKELLAQDGPEIMTQAREHRVPVYFEAAVAGGIPVIGAFKRGLVANHLTQLAAILNGTTNYILSEMTAHGREFEAVLQEAQALGYAEADPSADVDGDDALYKLAILASIMFGARIPVEQIGKEGIRRVSASDVAFARQFGYVIKLLAKARQSEQGWEARVHPCLVPADHPLSNVSGAFNALWVKGHAVGEVMLYGKGAGRLPTASAVVADLVNVASETPGEPNRLMSCLHDTTGRVTPVEETVSSFFVRLVSADRPGVLGDVGQVLGRHGVSIETLVQPHPPGSEAELVFITHPVREGNFRAAMEAIEALPTVAKVASILSVYA